MSQVITLKDIFEDTEYEPRIGLGYEIADGVVAYLVPPTYAHWELAESIGRGNDDQDLDIYEIAKQVLRCDKWPDKSQCVPDAVAEAVYTGFFGLLNWILQRRKNLQKASSSQSPPSEPA